MAQAHGILSSSGRGHRSGLTATLETGRRPFLMNIDCCIAVSVMSRTACASPRSITQRDAGIEVATDMTQFGRGKKAIDMMDMCAMSVGSLMQDLHKTPEAKIGYFASPHSYHAAQLQVLQVDRVIRSTEVMRQLPMPILSLVRNIGLHLRQTMPCLTSMARSWLGSCKGTVGLAQCPQRLFEWLRRSDIMTVVPGEKLCESKVKACGLTRLDSDD